MRRATPHPHAEESDLESDLSDLATLAVFVLGLVAYVLLMTVVT